MQNSSESEVSNPSEFSFTVWVKRGNMIVQRTCLDYDDPESVWMLWWNRFHEVIPMHICDQIWGKGAVTDQELAEVEKMLEQHEERLLIEMGAVITD
jgi:hypothetical protein